MLSLKLKVLRSCVTKLCNKIECSELENRKELLFELDEQFKRLTEVQELRNKELEELP